MIGLKCNKCGFVNNAQFQIYVTGEESGKREAIHSCKQCG
jgi:predicted nucleic-acid-binding Zn-ribbon protein